MPRPALPLVASRLPSASPSRHVLPRRFPHGAAEASGQTPTLSTCFAWRASKADGRQDALRLTTRRGGLGCRLLSPGIGVVLRWIQRKQGDDCGRGWMAARSRHRSTRRALRVAAGGLVVGGVVAGAGVAGAAQQAADATITTDNSTAFMPAGHLDQHGRHGHLELRRGHTQRAVEQRGRRRIRTGRTSRRRSRARAPYAYTFTQPGTYDYVCIIHAGMTRHRDRHRRAGRRRRPPRRTATPSPEPSTTPPPTAQPPAPSATPRPPADAHDAGARRRRA